MSDSRLFTGDDRDSGGCSSLAAKQAARNLNFGPRIIPAGEIPLPQHLDARELILAGGPYSPFWDLAPTNAAEWQALQQARAEQAGPVLQSHRLRLGVTSQITQLGGVGAYSLIPREFTGQREEHLIFFLHGGGYVLGQGESGTIEAVSLAAMGGYPVLSVDYRLAPQAPYPAALDDALAAWQAVIASTDPRMIAVVGISAGGGLALALMHRIQEDGLPLPGALGLGSPWSDMSQAGDSYSCNQWIDNVLVSCDGYLSRAAAVYAGTNDRRDHGISPIYGNFDGMPPTILFSGSRDLFLSNTIRTHRKLRQSNVEAELHVFEALSHSQYIMDPDASVTLETFTEMARFFDRHLI